MKKLLLFVAALMVSMISVSCTSDLYVTSDDVYTYSDGSSDISIVITYGTPYYYNGSLWYYFYNGLYYYPFWYDGYWYLRPYRTLYSWDWYYNYYHRFRPSWRDHNYRFPPGHHGFDRPGNGHSGRPHHPGTGYGPNHKPKPEYPNGHRPGGVNPRSGNGNYGHPGNGSRPGGVNPRSGNSNRPPRVSSPSRSISPSIPRSSSPSRPSGNYNGGSRPGGSHGGGNPGGMRPGRR